MILAVGAVHSPSFLKYAIMKGKRLKSKTRAGITLSEQYPNPLRFEVRTAERPRFLGLPPLNEQIISVVIPCDQRQLPHNRACARSDRPPDKDQWPGSSRPDFVDATRDTLVIGKYSIRMSKQSSGPLSVTRSMRKTL